MSVNQHQYLSGQSNVLDSNRLSSRVYFYQLKLDLKILGTKQEILLK